MSLSWRRPITAEQPDTDETDQWQVEAGGVDFLCLERKGGYDLTLLVAGVIAEFARSAIGTNGVSSSARTARADPVSG